MSETPDVRASWAPVLDAADCAIHGDMGSANVLMTDDEVLAAGPEYARRRLDELRRLAS